MLKGMSLELCYSVPSHLPGTDMFDLCGQLGLAEEASKVSQERLVRVYQEVMQAVEGECVKDLLELFLEKTELFSVSDSVLIPDLVNKELQVCWQSLRV